jgi:hypothetical protein
VLEAHHHGQYVDDLVEEQEGDGTRGGEEERPDDEAAHGQQVLLQSLLQLSCCGRNKRQTETDAEKQSRARRNEREREKVLCPSAERRKGEEEIGEGGVNSNSAVASSTTACTYDKPARQACKFAAQWTGVASKISMTSTQRDQISSMVAYLSVLFLAGVEGEEENIVECRKGEDCGGPATYADPHQRHELLHGDRQPESNPAKKKKKVYFEDVRVRRVGLLAALAEVRESGPSDLLAGQSD